MKTKILISFSGIDGAGKSTQIELLAEYLINKKKKVLVTEEMFGYFLLKPIIGSLRSATGSPSLGPVKRNKSLLLKLWFIPAFIDIWLSYIFKIKILVNNYDYVIADRFYIDIWANLLYYGYLPNWAFVYFVKLLPKADIGIMLSVEPKIVLKREREFPPKYYNEQKAIYDNLAAIVGLKIVEANDAPNSVFNKIIKIIESDIN